jgi:hypothetical protein
MHPPTVAPAAPRGHRETPARAFRFIRRTTMNEPEAQELWVKLRPHEDRLLHDPSDRTLAAIARELQDVDVGAARPSTVVPTVHDGCLRVPREALLVTIHVLAGRGARESRTRGGDRTYFRHDGPPLVRLAERVIRAAKAIDWIVATRRPSAGGRALALRPVERPRAEKLPA